MKPDFHEALKEYSEKYKYFYDEQLAFLQGADYGYSLKVKELENALEEQKSYNLNNKDMWQQEYEAAVNEIRELQDRLKDAENEIRDLQCELRSGR